MAKSKQLGRTVSVINPDDGFEYTFGPDDDVPSWAEKLITNPAAWESDAVPADDTELNNRGRVRREVSAPAQSDTGSKAAGSKASE